jgi:hypothetical protein
MSTYVAGAIDSRAPGAREIDQLLPHYLPLFYRTAFRHLGNQADAEDAVQAHWSIPGPGSNVDVADGNRD